MARYSVIAPFFDVCSPQVTVYVTPQALFKHIPVFPPERAIVGILCCNQRRPPEKRKKGQFSPLL